MAGYVVTERIDRSRSMVRPGLLATPQRAERTLTPDGGRDPETLGQRWAAVRTVFAQTTWYLFNPNSWR